MTGVQTCALPISAAAGDLVGASPNLAPLANNGGPTQTHALNAGSVAVDAGDPGVPGSGGIACEATDQRGTTRPQGIRCDIGAFEVAGVTPPPLAVTVVPTLSHWTLYALMVMLALFGLASLHRRSR